MSRKLYLLHRRIKDDTFKLLAYSPVSANTVTFSGILSSVTYVWTFNPIFLLYSLLTDFMDGSIARLQGTATKANRIYDIGADMLRFLCVMLALNFHAKLNIMYTIIVMLHLLSKTVPTILDPYIYIGKITWGIAWTIYMLTMLGLVSIVPYLVYVLVIDTSIRFFRMLVTR